MACAGCMNAIDGRRCGVCWVESHDWLAASFFFRGGWDAYGDFSCREWRKDFVGEESVRLSGASPDEVRARCHVPCGATGYWIPDNIVLSMDATSLHDWLESAILCSSKTPAELRAERHAEAARRLRQRNTTMRRRTSTG